MIDFEEVLETINSSGFASVYDLGPDELKKIAEDLYERYFCDYEKIGEVYGG